MNNDDMASLQQNLVNLYLKNLDFLKKSFPLIFEKINILSIKLEKEERYSIEFKDEGYFDIYDNKTNNFLYGINSYIEADIRAEKVDFSTNQSINLLRMDSNTNKFALMKTLRENNKLVNYLNEKIDFTNIKFDKVHKFIYIGTGLGTHIHEIDKKIKSMNTLIIEPNLEIFRLSLFLTDLEIFTKGNRTLFLSINESKNEQFETLTNFSHHHSYMNHTIKHHLFKYDYKYILDQIIDFYAIYDPSGFPYHSILEVTERTLNFMKKGYPFLQKKLLDENKPLKNKKVLTISAGPSLDKHIHWIKKHQDKFIIICVDVILIKLEKNNIKPDIVVSIDPFELCSKYLITQDSDFLKNSSIILLSQQHSTTMKVIEDKDIFFSQVYPITDELDYALSLSNVGTFSFFIANLLGAKEIYLTGCDAAFDQETGNRYASNSSQIINDHIADEEQNFISRSDILEVKGNLKEKVKTNRELLGFKEAYEDLIHLFKLKGNYFNLSSGAYIEGLKPLDFNQINMDDFTKETFNKNLLRKSSIKVKNIDFSDDIKTINNIIKKVEKFKQNKFKNKNEFMQQRIDITIWILKEKKKFKTNIMATIFIKFLEYVDIYINFTFNLNQRNIYKEEIFKQVNIYWSDSLISLLKNIKKAIQYENIDNLLSQEIENSNSKIMEYKFLNTIISVEKVKVKELYTENVIGFIASKENLDNNDFVQYIKDLINRFPDTQVKAFCLTEEQLKLAKNTLSDKITVSLIKSIEELINKIEIFIYLVGDKTLNHILPFLRAYCPNILSFGIYLNYDNYKNMSIKEFEKYFSTAGKRFMNNTDILEFNKNEILESKSYTITLQNVIYKRFKLGVKELDLNNSAYEYFNMKLIEYTLKNKQFKDFYFDLISKQIKILQKSRL